MDTADSEDEEPVGFGEWSDTKIDEVVREVKCEMEEDFEKDGVVRWQQNSN